MKFTPGFSGGAAVEVKFFNWFGVKAGLNVAQVVTHSYFSSPPLSTPIYDSETGVTITALANNSSYNEVTAELPVLAVFYAGVTDYLELYCGLGVAPSFITWSIFTDYDADGKEIESSSRYTGVYATGFTADIGLHWAAGPGKVTAGFVYMFTPRQQVFSFDTVNWSVNNLKLYAGYLF